MKVSCWFVVAAVAAVVGCSPSLKLPAEALVTCESDGDCPSGSVCKTAIQRCVAPGGDQTPPSVANASAPPDPAGVGKEILVTFDATEALAIDPVVSLAASAHHAMRKKSASGTHYVYSYVPDGTEGEGTWPIVADLVDLAGNSATAVAVANVSLDFTPPQILDIASSKSLFHAGDTAQLTFRATEAGSTPVVALASGGSFTLVSQSSGRYTFSYPVTGNEPAGQADVHITFMDSAGNAVGLDWTGLSFDFAPPTLTASQVITPAVRSGSTAAVSFTASEPLGADPVVQLLPQGGGAPLPMSVVQRIGSTYTLSYPVAGTEAEGGYDVVLSGWADLAGNAGSAVTLGQVAIDLTPPHVTAPIAFVGNNGKSLFKAGDLIEVSFTATEALAGSPQVTLTTGFPKGFDCTNSGLTYDCTLSAPLDSLTDVPEGPVGVLVQLTDLAGNQASASATATLDYTAPTVAPGSQSLRLLPGSGNPLSSIECDATRCRSGPGSTAHLAFTMSEPLDSTPVQVTSSDPSLTCSESGTSSPSLLQFDCPVPAGLTEDADYTFTVTATDRAGNPGSSAFGLSFTFDGTPPADPVTDASDDAFLYARTPWGSQASAGNPLFQLTAKAGSSEPGGWLIVADQNGLELGRASTPSDVNQPIVVDLLPRDLPAVYVRAVDAAGNQSAPVKVHDVVWTATLHDKVAKSLLENPHRFEQRGWFMPLLWQPDDVDTGGTEIGFIDGAGGTLTTRGTGTWQKVGLPTTITELDRPSFAFDSVRNRLELFGGAQSGNQEWEWGTSNYSQVVPVDPELDGNPFLNESNVTFDSTGGLTAVLGDGAPGYSSIWYWNGASWRRETPTLGPAPASRTNAALAYDPRFDQLVLFGGEGSNCTQENNPSQDCARTWEYQRGSVWIDRGLGAAPARELHAMAYDSAIQRVVMFGGFDAFHGTMFADTWTWDGSTWTQVPAGADDPPALAEASLAYDPGRQRLVLFGGCQTLANSNGICSTVSSAFTNKLWEFDGTSWHSVVPTDPEGDSNPPVRLRGALGYSPQLGGVVLYGGCQNCSSFPGADFDNDTWLWNGTSWRKLGPTASSPLFRAFDGLSYDSNRKVSVLFGGTSSANGLLGDTWEWDGSKWSSSPAVAPSAPSKRFGHAMAYDPVRQRTVLFGGCPDISGESSLFDCPNASGDTWEWDGTSWTQITPTDPEGDGNPSPRHLATMVYDVAHSQLLLYGGCANDATHTCGPWQGDIGDLWTWNGTSWRLLQASAAPGPRRGSAAVYDSARGTVLLFGGSAGFANSVLSSKGDLWEWDGSTWTSRASLDPNFTPVMFFDEGRGLATEQFVNNFSSGILASAWEWDDPSWSSIFPTDPDGDASPSGRSGTAMVYDSGRGEALMFGADAASGTSTVGQTWKWLGGANARPGQVVHFDLSQAQIGAGTVESIDASWYAGGSGSGSTGAKMLVWDLGAWQPIADPRAQNSSPASSPTQLQFSADATQLTRLFAADQKIHLAVVPLQPTGAGPWGQVSTDYVELSVKYHL